MSASSLQFDEDLAGQLIRDWQRPLFNFSLQWLRDEGEAADATQDIFLALLRDLHQLRSPDKLRGWIFRVASRILLRRKKRKQRRLDVVAPASVEASVEDADSLAEAELRVAVQAAVAELPEELRAAITLRYYQGLTQRELAVALEIPRSTAQSRLEKGLSLLRSRLPRGSLVLVPEIEALMSSTPPAPVPMSLKTGLAKLSASPALWTAGLAGGALIMNMKLSLAAAILALVAFGGGYSLSAVNRGERESRDAGPAYRIGEDGELERLRGRIALLEEEKASRARGAVVAAPKPVGGEAVAALKAKLERSEAEKSALRERLRALEEKADPDSPRVLLRKYLAALEASSAAMSPEEKKLYEDYAAGLENLSQEERVQRALEFQKSPLAARLMKVQQEFASIFMKLLSNRAETMTAVLEMISDRGEENRDRLAETIMMSLAHQAEGFGQNGNLDMSPFNPRLLDFAADPTESQKVRFGALSALDLRTDPAVQDRALDVLLGLARGDDPSLRQLAWAKLGTMPTERARSETRWLLLDSDEPAETRLKVLRETTLTAGADGSTLILQLARDDQPSIRRAAYAKALGLETRPELRAGLSAALSSETDPAAQSAIVRALGAHGDAGTVRQLEALAASERYPVALRSQAEQTAGALARRLASKTDE